MKAEQDGSGKTYFDVANIRVTCVEKTWSGQPGLRLQAYKENGQLNPGAEIPIPDKSVAFDLVSAIMEAVKANGL